MKSKIVRLKIWYEADETAHRDEHAAALEREVAEALRRGLAKGQTSPVDLYHVDVGEGGWKARAGSAWKE